MPSSSPAAFDRTTKTLLFVALCCCALMSTGCVRRRMTIRTTPPGAKVYVDDLEIGTTPVSTNFTYYASRKITIIKDGFRTETSYQRVWPTWYEVPPLDFFSENIVPWELRDERVLDFQLVPQEIVPQERLLGRAENLRNNARLGIMSPLPPSQYLSEPAAPPQPVVSYPGEGLPGNEPQLPPPVDPLQK